jgi:hypothetical protein
MKIEIEIPEEFEKDYTADKFADFLGRVRADIDYNGMCGNYERETADVLAEAFKNSRIVQQVAYKGRRLIDADAMNELLFYKQVGGKDSLITAESAFEMINAQPTAYDVDKVLEQLEERTAFLKYCTKYGNKTAEQQSKSYDTMMMYEVKDLVDDLIEIVKGGGTDGN